MSARWCSNSSITDPALRRAAVWSPWFGCKAGGCETFYQAMYDPAGPKVKVDNSVTRDGGMVSRTCRVPNVGDVACSYIDPAKAQGFSSWNIPAGAPPVAAPFYVYALNGREVRVWLRNDTGYDSTIAPRSRSPATPVGADLGQGRHPVRPHHEPRHVQLDRLAAPHRHLAGRARRGHQRRRPTGDVRHRPERRRLRRLAGRPQRRLVGMARLPRADRRQGDRGHRGSDGFLVLAVLDLVGRALAERAARHRLDRLGPDRHRAGQVVGGRPQPGRPGQVYALDAGGSVWHAWQMQRRLDRSGSARRRRSHRAGHGDQARTAGSRCSP